MRRLFLVFVMLSTIVAWAVGGSTSFKERDSFSIDRHTVEGQTLVYDSLKGRSPALYDAGRSAEDFLTPDGRFNLKAIRASGYQGPLDLKGFDVGIEPHTGEPVLSPFANTRISSHPDDTFWTPLGSGMNGRVEALAVYDNKLMAGGDFTTAGGDSAYYIASWDGSSWSPLGWGMNNWVDALAVYDNKLIAGGYFTTAGGVGANNIASWNGSFWSPLGSGINDWVYALAVYDNKLIAGGYFTTAGGVSAICIASWDGSSWSPLGSWVKDGVSALAVYDNKLIAGGGFITAGGVGANYIASWDGSSWSPLGSGMNSRVLALAVYDNKLIAGGYFTTAGGDSVKYIASWDGSSWSALGSGMNDWVYALAVYDNKLIAGGEFTTAGGKVSAYIAQWTKHSPGDVGDGDNEWSLPPDFSLKQNYPNPFNPTTTIEYNIPKRGYVKIEIFNLLGQKVRNLVDEYKSAGNYSVTWDGTDNGGNPLATGIYFCRFRAGDHVQTKKLVLIK